MIEINSKIIILGIQYKVIKILKRNRFKLKEFENQNSDYTFVYDNLFLVDENCYEIIQKKKRELIIKLSNENKDRYERLKKLFLDKIEEQTKYDAMSDDEKVDYDNKKEMERKQSYANFKALIYPFLEKMPQQYFEIIKMLK